MAPAAAILARFEFEVPKRIRRDMIRTSNSPHSSHATRCKAKEIVMGKRFSGLIVTAAIAAAASAAISVSVTPTSAQAPAVSGAALKTPPLKTAWGEPDLQGIWTDEFDTPLQRPAKYANQEFFTEAQRAELDQARSGILNRRATERDANNGYNGAAFFSMKRTGARTSRIADPPNGRLPALTPDAQKTAAAEREFRVALTIDRYVQKGVGGLRRLEIRPGD